MLLGRWDNSYGDGISPMFWIGSVDILRRWKSSGCQQVKYGQCWVFAAVACTGERSAGRGRAENRRRDGAGRALEWGWGALRSSPASAFHSTSALCGLEPAAAPLWSSFQGLVVIRTKGCRLGVSLGSGLTTWALEHNRVKNPQ